MPPQLIQGCQNDIVSSTATNKRASAVDPFGLTMKEADQESINEFIVAQNNVLSSQF